MEEAQHQCQLNKSFGSSVFSFVKGDDENDKIMSYSELDAKKKKANACKGVCKLLIKIKWNIFHKKKNN